MNLYHIKLTDNQKDALERLFNMGIVWNKTELSEAWEQLREQLREAERDRLNAEWRKGRNENEH